MAKKVSNFSDLVQRVTANCLLHPLGSGRFHQVQMTPDHRYVQIQYPTTISEELQKYIEKDYDEGEKEHEESVEEKEFTSSSENDTSLGEIYEDARENEEDGYKLRSKSSSWEHDERERSACELMGQVFDSISSMKRAYGKLQEAHNPWDPEKMRVADAAVVAELRRLAVLRERFKRKSPVGLGNGRRESGVETVREVVAPYEAAVEELKKEVKAKDVEVEELREKVRCMSVENGKKSGRSSSRKKGGSIIVQQQVSASSLPEMFETTMSQVRETSKSFTSHLLSLMRSAHWDLSAAVRSIEAAISSTGSTAIATSKHQAKYALESYILRKIFQGFDHETFYMDGTLSSLINPSQFRQDCFSKYRDMKSMDPSELLGILPNSPFGVFCSKKYQDIVHPKMEESLFGNLDQRNQLLSGSHPRTRFYTDFLALAKSVWLLHLLAFSLEPPPSHFEASRGAEFHSVYMESVARFPGAQVPSGQVVGFPVSPGFKLGNGSVVKARVYLVPRN